jgi:hypothetical protein
VVGGLTSKTDRSSERRNQSLMVPRNVPRRVAPRRCSWEGYPGNGAFYPILGLLHECSPTADLNVHTNAPSLPPGSYVAYLW